MKPKMKLIPILLLAFLLVVSLIPPVGMTAQAEDAEPGVCYLKVFLDPADEEFSEYRTVEVGSVPSKPDDPEEPEGMTFMGWYKDRALTVPFDFSSPMYEDTDIFPKFGDSDNVVGVNFFMGPDEDYPFADQMLLKGELVQQPADPSNGDLVFAGWYSDRELKNKYDFSTPVQDYLYLFARFVNEEDCYTVWIYLNADDEDPLVGFDVPKGDPIPAREDPGKDDYIFTGWYTDKELTQPADLTTPRSEDVSLYAGWKSTKEEDCYTVLFYLNAEDEDPLSGIDVPKGDPIPKPEDPAKEDYEFTGWYTDKELTQPADFTIPRSEDVTLYGGWKLILPDNPFVDVKSDDYFSDPVLWALKKNITKGTDDTHFSPETICTRGQVVTFLWRAAGSPEPDSSVNPFTDVKTDDYFCKAVLWAVKEGITKGTSDTTFGPEQSCTRGQVAAFLYRAEGSPKSGSIENPFTDVTSGQYYYDAVLWAVTQKITQGTGAGTFSPDATCTRGQIVTFLYRDMN